MLFNDAGLANGSSGLVFNKVANTLTANTLVVTGNADFSAGSSYIKFPIGTTAQRPAGANGMARFNSTLGYLEWYDFSSSNWQPFYTGPTYSIDYLIVAGGGGGGNYNSGPTTRSSSLPPRRRTATATSRSACRPTTRRASSDGRASSSR